MASGGNLRNGGKVLIDALRKHGVDLALRAGRKLPGRP